MTGWGFAAVTVTLVALAALYRDVRPRVGPFVAPWRDLVQRMVAVRETLADVEREKVGIEQKRQQPAPSDPMPDDLRAMVTAWEDPWAQADQKAILDGLYGELGDWEKVRQSVMRQPAQRGPSLTA